MSFLFTIIFLIMFAIFALNSKSDLYAHEHDSSIQKELDDFNTNFKELENIEINNSYSLSNEHLYNNK